MAHFAELDDNNVVTQVIVVNNAELLDNGVDSEAKGVAFLAGLFGHDRWRQTSYNATTRKNYAGIGFTYDAARDAFIAPQPFASWTLDESVCQWVPPVPRPQDGKAYAWDEAAQSWQEITA